MHRSQFKAQLVTGRGRLWPCFFLVVNNGFLPSKWEDLASGLFNWVFKENMISGGPFWWNTGAATHPFKIGFVRDPLEIEKLDAFNGWKLWLWNFLKDFLISQMDVGWHVLMNPSCVFLAPAAIPLGSVQNQLKIETREGLKEWTLWLWSFLKISWILRVDFGRRVFMFFKLFLAPPPIPLGSVENPLTFYKFEGLKGWQFWFWDFGLTFFSCILGDASLCFPNVFSGGGRLKRIIELIFL